MGDQCSIKYYLLAVTILCWFGDGVLLIDINIEIMIYQQWEYNSYIMMDLFLDS